MKIAIHSRKGSFSQKWIDYCEREGIEYVVVNAYDSDIITQLKNVDAFMWHHHQQVYADTLVANSILFSLEEAGVRVFPDYRTSWHFDDKVAQKYLLEAIDAPIIPSYVFLNKKDALNWAKNTTYPKVFKLRGGASGLNVKLVNNESQTKVLINKAFGKGFSPFSRINYFKDQWSEFRKKKNYRSLLKGVVRFFLPPKYYRMVGNEVGYIYFQEFIPNNSYDIRLIVINQKYAYGMKRMNRKNDFRASGSANFVYDDIPDNVLKIAFETVKKLRLQSVAFDFIFDGENNPLIIEMSYCFGTKGSSQCRGYWTEDLKWHEESFNPMGWMVESLR